MDACYAHPRTVNSSAVCLLYLTLAIGLVLATPIPNSFEDSIIKKLRAERLDRAEVFFRNAKELGDPVSGFGDADLWSIQALTLMCVYTLAISKRNLAWSYHGQSDEFLVRPFLPSNSEQGWPFAQHSHWGFTEWATRQ